MALLGTGGITPALARDGSSSFSSMTRVSPAFSKRVPPVMLRSNIVPPHTIARRIGILNSGRFSRREQLRNGLPIAIWPGWSYVGTMPIDVPPAVGEAPSAPQFIVMSALSDRAPERPVTETPPDFGYIEGCRAIPNGYHCNIAHDGAVASPGG
jgi:hypothetical protein